MSEKINIFLQNINNELSEIENKTQDIIEEANVMQSNISLERYIDAALYECDTVGVTFDPKYEVVYVYTKNGNNKTTKEFEYTKQGYLEFCNNHLRIKTDEKFNFSINWFDQKVDAYIRCFSLLQPISEYPNVTISISKNPGNYTIHPPVKPFVEQINASNILIAGGTGSGKTTLLNILLNASKHNKSDRICFVEEFRELWEPNENTISLSVPTEIPGEPYLFDFIVRKTNLMRFDKVYVGEIKGPEMYSFINQLAAGVKGGTTVHAGNCTEAMVRAANLAASAGISDYVDCCKLIASTIKYVIYVEKHEVKEIIELTGVYNEKTNTFQRKSLYNVDKAGAELESSIG